MFILARWVHTNLVGKDGRWLAFVYATHPEGHIIELQKWDRQDLSQE